MVIVKLIVFHSTIGPPEIVAFDFVPLANNIHRVLANCGSRQVHFVYFLEATNSKAGMGHDCGRAKSNRRVSDSKNVPSNRIFIHV